MFTKKFRSIVCAISVLSGTIIGVGLFSLPYLTLRVGWFSILLYFLILGSLVALLHVLFGELVLKTPDHIRFPGIANHYWGKKGKNFTLLTHVSCLIGAILAYIIVGGEFLQALMSSAGFEISLSAAILIYLMAGGLIIYFGSSGLNMLHLSGIIGFFLVMVGLTWMGWDEISVSKIFARNGDSVSWFAPYGVVIFSLWGATLIPQIEDILGKNNRYMTKVIIASLALPALVYLYFIIVVLGISGSDTSPSALTSMGSYLGKGAESMILVFGLITTFTSFVAIGFTLAQVFEFDLGIKKIKAWFLSLFLPLSLYLAGVRDFLELIVFLGSVLLATDGINMLLMYRKGLPEARAWKRWAAILLILMLFGGIVYEINSLIR